RRGARRNLKRDAPGHLVLIECEDLIIEGRLRSTGLLLRCGPVADDLQPSGIEEVKLGVSQAGAILDVLVDVPAWFELGRYPIRQRLARVGLGWLDRGRKSDFLGHEPGVAVRTLRIALCGEYGASADEDQAKKRRRDQRATRQGKRSGWIDTHGDKSRATKT